MIFGHDMIIPIKHGVDWELIHQQKQTQINRDTTQENKHRVYYDYNRGSIPAKVGFWVGLRIFSYVPTATKLTNAISKTQLSGPKKGVFLPKIPRKCPFFVFGVF